MALVTHLLKKKDLDLDVLSNYRPISNLSFLSKLLERVVLDQLIKHLESESLYIPTQSAFRRSHSTETALLCVFNDIHRAIDRGEISLLVLLNQTAAFDFLGHPTLLHRLTHRYGICGIILLYG